MNLQGGQSQDPLAQLRDIHLPEAVSWWPPAPGWWLLTLLLFAGLALLGRLLWLHRQRNAYRRQGEEELVALYAKWQKSSDTLAYLQHLNALLKRVALFSFPHADVAAMNGARWTDFLDQRLNNNTDTTFSGGPLEYGPYADTVGQTDVEVLHHASLRWLREHRGDQ